jgi:HK97 family phage portal protein
VFLPDEVYHLKTDTDIDNEIVGRSKMKTLLIELMTDEEASQSNLAFFTNNQTPSSIIILDDDVDFKDETQKAKVLAELKSMFNTGKHTGGKNHHRSAFAKGIKEIVKIQDKISDMEFLDLRKFTLDLVCGVYEVPKDILGYTETSNRSVGDAQGNNFDDTIQGKKHTISNFLTRIIREVLGIEYAFDFKIDEQALKVRNIKTAGEAWQSGVAKLNEAREIANLEPDLKRGDEYYQSKPAEVDPKKQKLTIK